VIVLGIILLILGFIIGSSILWILGLILLILGIVFNVLGAANRGVRGRRYYW
jgi:hypothetical protein